MRKLAVLVCIAVCVAPSRGRAQVATTVSRPTVMIVVEPNRTRIDGRQLRAAITRQLPVIAVPVSFPRAMDSSAWIAISQAEDGKIALRVRRVDGRGASRVERAPEAHTLEWLLDRVRWLLEASASATVREHPRMASSADLEQNLHQLGDEPRARAPLTDLADLDRFLARDALPSPGGASALATPTP